MVSVHENNRNSFFKSFRKNKGMLSVRKTQTKVAY